MLSLTQTQIVGRTTQDSTNLQTHQQQHEPKLSVRAKLDTVRESERLAKDPLFYMKVRSATLDMPAIALVNLEMSRL